MSAAGDDTGLAPPSPFCFAIPVALLAPALLGRPAALAGRPLRGLGGSGFLAAAGLATGRFRTGAVAAAIALIVALAGAQVVASATARSAAEHESADRHGRRARFARPRRRRPDRRPARRPARRRRGNIRRFGKSMAR